ncbi:MAG: hypothetical protein ACRYG8_45995 [Janthinobacterium lividum]
MAPWDIHAVVLTTYEAGADRGDAPGELQPWVQGERLTERVAFPLGVHDLYTDPAHHLLVMVTGTTTGPAAASVMALGTDTRFDLRHAYWLVDGISGFDPKAAPLGSVVWVDAVVTDIMRGIDPREMPRDWPYGFFMEGAARPDQYRPPDPTGGVVHTLCWFPDPKLLRWALALTKDTTLIDSPRMLTARALWRGFPKTQKPPQVLTGGDFAADTFWHGAILTGFAEDWVKLVTQDRSSFVTSDMEDGGIMESFGRLAKADRVDGRRILLLRSNANYTRPHPGETAADSLNGPFAADTESLENGYRVGARVIHTLLADWPRYAARIPGD